MPERKAVITGVDGQDGSYLADFLLRRHYRVIGLSRSLHPAHLFRLRYLGIEKHVQLLTADICDTDMLRGVVNDFRPDEWYNLAGQSNVSESWQRPADTFAVNAGAVSRFLSIIKDSAPQLRFFQASSSEMYGAYDGVVTESTDRFNPLTPYGVSKLASHLLTKLFRTEFGLYTVSGILFNHESPLRGQGFVSSKIAEGVAKIRRGEGQELALGNLDARRDWGYAKEYVEAMWLMLQQDTPDDYVIATGETHSVREFVAEAFQLAGLEWEKYVRIDESLLRFADPTVSADPAYTVKRLGWKSKTNFKALVKILAESELARGSAPV